MASYIAKILILWNYWANQTFYRKILIKDSVYTQIYLISLTYLRG